LGRSKASAVEREARADVPSIETAMSKVFGFGQRVVRKQASHYGRIDMNTFAISCAIFETDHEKDHTVASYL
jgi:hypothetical protein